MDSEKNEKSKQPSKSSKPSKSRQSSTSSKPSKPSKPKVDISKDEPVKNTSSNDKLIPKQIEYKSIITHIYHISDLHIQLYKRHQEYRIVFQHVYNYLIQEKNTAGISATQNRNIPLVIVITGDILHSKADLSPECIQLTYEFIKTLSSIMPVFLIAGNHDININNRERLDSLTPILADLPAVQPVYYLLESDIYQCNNVIFHYSSITDPIIKLHHPDKVFIKDSDKNIRHIALYHGRVNGAVYFNGMTCNDPINNNITNDDVNGNNGNNGNKTITPSAFEHYDMALLGDIHKMQFLAPNIAYAGSLIQQNIGESIEGHGIIKWTLETRTGIHIPIHNDWSFISINIENKHASYLCTAPNGTHNHDCNLTKNISIRILYRNTPESYLMDFITLMKMHHNVIDYRWSNDTPLIGLEEVSGNTTDTTTLDTNIQRNNSLVDITSPEVQMRYLEDIIKANESDITPEDINEIRKINLENNIQLRDTNKQFNNYAFNGHYKLKRLEFSNLFSFGENNVIDFLHFKGIVGIIAPNHLGKSSIIDIIVYTLFDDFTRKGSTKDIININKDNFRVRLDISINEWTYTIIKTGYRTRIGASVRIEFYRSNDKTGIIEKLEEDNTTKTKERIMEYFGCYEDIIHTSFSIQHDNACFIDSSNIKRKDELERIMRFEIVKKLYEQVNHHFNKDKAIYEHIRKKIKSDDIVNMKKDKTRFSRYLDITLADKEYAKECITRLQKSIFEESGKLNKECDEFIKHTTENQDETEETLKCLESELINNEMQISELQGIIPNGTDRKQLENNELAIVKEINEIRKKIKPIDNTIEKLLKSRRALHNNTLNTTNNSNIIIETIIETMNAKLVCIRDNILHFEDTMKKLESDKITARNKLKKEITIKKEELAKLQHREIETKIETTIMQNLADIADIDYKEIISNSKQYLKLKDDLRYTYLLCLTKLINKWIDKNSDTHCDLTVTINRHLDCDIKYTDEFENLEESIIQYGVITAIENYLQTSDCLISRQTNNKNVNELQEILISNIQKMETQLDNELNDWEKEIPKKIAKLQTEEQMIKDDIVNLEFNNKIDIEIARTKEQKAILEGNILLKEEELTRNRHLLTSLRQLEQYEITGHKLALQFKEAQTVLATFEKYKAEIEVNREIEKVIDSLKIELGEYESTLKLIEKKEIEERTALNKITTILEQMKKDIQEGRIMETRLRLQEIYKNALRELPYILLGKIQPLLERKVNDFLSITTDFTVRFDMSDNKIDIYLDRAIYKYKDSGRSIIINNASGFERFMASLAIRIALLELSNLPKINFLAIDEGWGSFDTHNINNVSMILDYLTTKFDFVLTISHLIQIKEHCDIQLSLRRDHSGFSKIIY